MPLKNNKIRIRKHLLFLGFILVLYTPNSFGSRNSIEFENENQLLLIGKQTLYLEDKTACLSINDILDKPYQEKFQKSGKDVFSKPSTRSAYWYKFVAENRCSQDIWLEVGSTYAWYIDFYSQDSSGAYKSFIETGTMRLSESKLYDVNLFWLPLNSAFDSLPKTYYLRIESGLTFELPLHVGTIRSLSKNKEISDYLTAGFIGIMLIMFLYNTFIYFSTRDRIYLYYIGYIFLMAISMPYANGYPFIQEVDFWFFDKQWWNNNFLLWHPLVYFFIGSFCIRYFDLSNNQPWIKRLIQLEMIVISGVFPLLTIFGLKLVDLVNIFQVLILLFYLTCLITGYYYAIKKVRIAFFYIFGWTFMVTGVFIFFAVVNGFLPYNTFTRNMLYFGVSLEVWMFSLALGNRLNILRREKEKMQLENINLINKQNEILEANVAERTDELQVKNEELEVRNNELVYTAHELQIKTRQLEELNNTKNQLFAIVSHDLRSPLITLKNLLYLIDDKSIDAKTFQVFSSKLKNDVEHLHYTLNNLLQWAISQMEGLKINPVQIPLIKLVEENILLLNEYSLSKKIIIENSTDQQIEIFVDPDFMLLVIRNLLYNALKFTPQGGFIKIESKLIEGYCQLSFADNGVGMTQNVLDKLFQKKSAKSKIGTEGEKGTGLGLMLCQEFIERNGGKIWAESSEGVGSTFYFTVPLKGIKLIRS